MKQGTTQHHIHHNKNNREIMTQTIYQYIQPSQHSDNTLTIYTTIRTHKPQHCTQLYWELQQILLIYPTHKPAIEPKVDPNTKGQT